MIPVDLLKPADKTESATLDRPLDHLVACHRRIEERLFVLERAVAQLGDQTEESLYACQSVISNLDSSCKLHTDDEEESFFPRIRKDATSDELEYLDRLELEHREAEGFFARLKILIKQAERDPSLLATREALAKTAAKLAEYYRAHIASENAVLIRIGHARLDEVALAEIAFEMRLRRTHGV